MRVLLVHNHYRQAGGEDRAFELEMALLKQMGHAVVAYERSNNGLQDDSFLDRFRAAGRAIWAADSRKDVASRLKETHSEVAHFHNTFPMVSPAPYYACREAGVPVVQTVHNYRLVCPNALLFRDGQPCESCLGKMVPWPGVLHSCYRGSRAGSAAVAGMLTAHRLMGTWKGGVDVYVALSKFARRKLVQGGLPEDKVVVKPNFLEPDPGASSEARDHVLFVGRLAPEKGVSTLLQAWRRLRGIPLKVVGEGPLFEEAASSLSMDDHAGLTLMGSRQRKEVIGLMQAARFLVFPSECYEGFPMTLVEAFATGLPVIGSRLGAVEEIVDDGRTGLLFEAGDAVDLAAKVEWAWSHPEAMAEMGREARREYEGKYTAQRNYGMLMDVYERALASRHAH